VSPANPETDAGECLSVFLFEGETASECLTDPQIVGERPAPGHWRLLGTDASRQRAYYARIEHTRWFGCGTKMVSRGTYIYPPVSRR
jgi:hypothetical protein